MPHTHADQDLADSIDPEFHATETVPNPPPDTPVESTEPDVIVHMKPHTGLTAWLLHMQHKQSRTQRHHVMRGLEETLEG